MVISILAILFCLLHILPTQELNDENSDLYRTLQEINKRIKTTDFEDVPPSLTSPTEVKVDVNIMSVSNVQSASMDYWVDVFLTQQWIDRRMIRNTTLKDVDVALPDSFLKKFWIPDAAFSNAKQGSVVTISDVSKVLKLNSKTGKLQYSQRIRAQLACSMDMRYFPFDRQECEIQLESFRYNTDILQLVWLNNNSQLLDKKVDTRLSDALPSFDVNTTFIRKECSSPYKYRGNFSCLELKVDFFRNIQFYIFDIYIPSLLMVTITWMSFWIERRIIQGRTALGSLTMVAISNQINAVKAILPKSTQTKSVDIWLWTCQFYVLGSFIEFGIINWLSRRDIKRAARIAKEDEERLAAQAASRGERKQETDAKAAEEEIDQDEIEEQIMKGNVPEDCKRRKKDGQKEAGTAKNGIISNGSSRQNKADDHTGIELNNINTPTQERAVADTTRPSPGRWSKFKTACMERHRRSREKWRRSGWANRVDILSRAFFPGTFILFAIIYFAVELTDSKYLYYLQSRISSS